MIFSLPCQEDPPVTQDEAVENNDADVVATDAVGDEATENGAGDTGGDDTG